MMIRNMGTPLRLNPESRGLRGQKTAGYYSGSGARVIKGLDFQQEYSLSGGMRPALRHYPESRPDRGQRAIPRPQPDENKRKSARIPACGSKMPPPVRGGGPRRRAPPG